MAVKPEQIRFQLHFEDTVHISLGRGLFTSVDLEDFLRLAMLRQRCWSVTQYGGRGPLYAVLSLGKGKQAALHRIVMGDCPHVKRTRVDHIDGDGLHNCAVNLRWVSGFQNARNSPSSCRPQRTLFVCLVEHFRFTAITDIEDQLKTLAASQARLLTKPERNKKVCCPVFLNRSGLVTMNPPPYFTKL